MIRVVVAGTVLALVAGLIVLLAPALGTEVQGVALLGAAVGGTLGLVPDRSPAARVGGFLVGFVAAWAGYLVRAAVLPDAPSGRAVAVVLVVLVCVGVTAATRRRLPLWAHLLGAGALAGAYEAAYTADPANVAATSPTAASAVLLTAAAGFLATALLAPVARAELGDELSAGERAEQADRADRADRPEPGPAPAAVPAPGVGMLRPLTTREG